MVKFHIESYSKKGNQVVGGKFFEYEDIDNSGTIKRKHAYLLETTKPLPEANGTTSFTPVHLEGGMLKRDNHYAVDPNLTLSYNGDGKIKEFIKRDGIPVSYYRAYHKNYPVVKAVNVHYDDLKQAISQADKSGYNNLDEFLHSLDFFRYNLELDEEACNRWARFVEDVQAAFPHGRISFFTFRPMIGNTSRTTPNGKTTYFNYDGMGRLRVVKDHAGNIVRKMDYRYKSRLDK